MPTPTLKSFVHQAASTRVVFGPGALDELPQELARLGLHRPLLLCTPGQRALADRCAARLESGAAGLFDRAVMHVPVETVAAAMAEADRVRADGLVALGGGSTTGLAKALALRTGLPIVAVPTTYAGSEMTPIYGITEGGLKTTGRDERVRPRTVLYDPELSLSLPIAVTLTSGFNALAHAAEGLYAPDGNPLIALMAEEGLRTGAAALRALAAHAQDAQARSDALIAAWLCGTVLGATTMGLHHKLCHTLGGSFNLPHAEVHTVILPHALAYNAPAAPQAMQRAARALAVDDAARGLFDLAGELGAPTSLKAIGMPADGLDRAADLAARTPYPNPRPLDRDALRALLQRAYDGAPPRT